eukprot:UN00333
MVPTVIPMLIKAFEVTLKIHDLPKKHTMHFTIKSH